MLILSRNPLIVDDIHPKSSCDNLLQKADVLYVIPNFNTALSENSDWCAQIKAMNKTIGLHGITHQYHEFDTPISEKEIQFAIKEFTICFNEKPTLFRPPYNKISKENEALIAKYNLTLYKQSFSTQPYCHCNPKSLMKILNWILFC